MSAAVKTVARVSSNEGSKCAICSQWIDGSNDFTAGVNHYLQQHGATVLHVGQEDIPSDDGKPWATTVAVIGM